MSFWMVPASWSWLTPCSSPATTNEASTGSTAPFMVIDTDIWSSGMPSKRIFMSSTESMATPGLADVAHHAGVVGVVAAVGGEVEGHRHALLAGGQVAAVEGVGLLGGGEAGVLADGPRPVGVHGGPHAAGERREAGQDSTSAAVSA
jgi:hypothetical protein